MCVSGDDVNVRVDDGDKGLVEIGIAQTDGFQQGTMWCTFKATLDQVRSHIGSNPDRKKTSAYSIVVTIEHALGGPIFCILGFGARRRVHLATRRLSGRARRRAHRAVSGGGAHCAHLHFWLFEWRHHFSPFVTTKNRPVVWAVFFSFRVS
jgi:hypothetical protein